jgi:hypothetical protein
MTHLMLVSHAGRPSRVARAPGVAQVTCVADSSRMTCSACMAKPAEMAHMTCAAHPSRTSGPSGVPVPAASHPCGVEHGETFMEFSGQARWDTAGVSGRPG